MLDLRRAPQLLSVLLVFTGLLALLTSAAGVQAQAPSLQLEPAAAAPGEHITLRGAGWPAGASLVARIYQAGELNGPGADLGMPFQANQQGSFEVEGTIPLTLFGAGSRGSLTVVPGDYTIVVRGGPELAASTAFTVGAPGEGALLWGDVVFDTNGDRRHDAGDVSAGGLVGVALAANRVEAPSRQAITDARGRYLFGQLQAGTYYLQAEAQYQSERWFGTVSTSVGTREAKQLDLLLQRSPAPIESERCFAETSYCVEDDAFWNYFTHRDGIETLGYPVSRTFQLLGRRTQFFQRLVLQQGPDGGIQSLNLLDPGLLPYTSINGSQFPAPDLSLKNATPSVDQPGYDTRIVEFVRQVAPDVLDSGPRVAFFSTFAGTVSCADAFPAGSCRPELLPLLNLEIWGAPISRPTPDPTNHQFVYVRFQRGIMHYQGTDPQGDPITEGILLADWFKSLITGQNLPLDLEAQAQADDSPFLRQYCPGNPASLCEPERLPGTDLTGAFEPHLARP